MGELDLLVLGGGCAGLALALRLTDHGTSSPRTLVLEGREGYEDDRTWSFWRTRAHRFEDLVSASWNRMAVGSDGRLETYDCGATPYQMLTALPYYEHVQERIEGCGAVSLQLGARVTGDPVPDGDGWLVRTAHETFRARHVIDTRPPTPLPECLLWQSFLGQVVTVEAPSFDPQVLTLMDFDDPNRRGVQFSYVLPLSAHEALVETTVFGPQALAASELRGDLDRATARLVGGGPVSVRRSEHSALPMGLTGPLTPRPWVQAGLFHGGARPSTGYAFQRIQAWADTCAASLLGDGTPRAVQPDPLLRRAMDTVFLRVLRAEPERGPELLAGLFARAPTERVIRFLSDLGSPLDALAIVRSLPPGPFIREAGAALLRRPLGEIG